MTESAPAVFLSYASEDAPAAHRICLALRAAGIDVWFDQSELRGGDAWDAAIRKQIKACALFVPVISANAHARVEGYFRLEWKLAVDRSHLIAPDQAFLLPVVIDRSPQADERIPERFRELQWTHLPGGDTPPAFVERVRRLLSPAADVPAAPARTAATVSDTSHGPESGPPRGKGGWRSLPALWLTALIAVLTLGYLATNRFLRPERLPGAVPGVQQGMQSAAPVASVIPEKSIAVLPFVDMSEKRDQEYFSDGLTEELLDLLTQVPDLRVPARTSSFFYKGKSEDVSVIAQKLRVAHVLEGSVRKAGNTIRVTAQLIRADNGYHLWSKAYDRDVKDIFMVQDEIAAAVVEALKAKLLPAQGLAGRHRTANTEAYRQYLLGNQYRVRDTPDSNRQALVAYQKAIALDPGYAAAYSGVSETEWRIADQSTSEAAAYQRAAAAADRAIALAPDSPEGYRARGQLRVNYYFDWPGAQADFEQALALDPTNVPVLIDEGLLLATLGRMPDGITTLRKAIAQDPLSVVAWRWQAWLLMHSGQLPAAHLAVQRMLEIDPQGDTSGRAGALALLEGRASGALAIYQAMKPSVAAGWDLFGIAMAQHMLGHAAESQRALDLLIKNGAYAWAFQVAEVYAWRGEKDRAFEWLERAYRQHDAGMTFVTFDRFLGSLHGDPRYEGLLRELKLAP